MNEIKLWETVIFYDGASTPKINGIKFFSKP